jgi:hypothetical protein
LVREGIRVARFENRPVFLDREIDTLILADVAPLDLLGASFSGADAAALADWVRAGGRLVFLGDGPLRMIASETLGSSRERRHESKAAIAREAFGRGAIVFVRDAAAFENGSLANDDNARLAYALARPRGVRGVVAFDEAVRGHLVPAHWWDALPRRLVAAIGLIAVVLAVALFGAAIRLGPPLVVTDERATSSEAYLDALAALYERARAVPRALEDALASTRRALARRETASADGALAASLGELEGIASVAHPTEATLVRALSLALVIRKELERHGTG